MSVPAWLCRAGRRVLSMPVASRHAIRSVHQASDASTILPALLQRAHNLNAEHDQLEHDLATAQTYEPKKSRRLGELSRVADALKQWEKATESIRELRALLDDASQDAELHELAQADLLSTQTELQDLARNLTLSLVPRDPFHELPCLVEIRPGAGGDEAAIFAGELLRMYKAYCARRRFRTSMLKYDTMPGETGGNPPIAEAILEIEAAGAYGELRSEAGVHRVQRVPATEAKGRTHTSAVSVLVLPSFPETGAGQELDEADLTDPNNDYYVDVTEVKVETMKSSGAGGQHVNTTDSAVRLTHVPTGTVVNMQDSRSQHQNRKKAWQVLRSRLAQARRDAREEERARLRRTAGAQNMGREHKIRTYNYGQQRVTDHRSGLSVLNLDDVMEAGGSLDRIIDSAKSWMLDQDLRGLMADEEASEQK